MPSYKAMSLLIPLLLAFLPVAAFAQDVLGGGHPSVSEATLLPKFCWNQLLGDKFKGPEFEIPRETCGIAMNHYCPALVALGRAHRSISDEYRLGNLETAKRGVLYTLKGMEKYPHCPIRAQVMGTYQQVERELRVLR
jgi:hypothetical protein